VGQAFWLCYRFNLSHHNIAVTDHSPGFCLFADACHRARPVQAGPSQSGRNGSLNTSREIHYFLPQRVEYSQVQWT
jgi:hypothetical protein